MFDTIDPTIPDDPFPICLTQYPLAAWFPDMPVVEIVDGKIEPLTKGTDDESRS